MRVTEGNTDLRGRETLAGELDDLVDYVLRARLEPRGPCVDIRLDEEGVSVTSICMESNGKVQKNDKY